jgi:hypothetical protein
MTRPAGPTTERGSLTGAPPRAPGMRGLLGWGAFSQEAEHVPELRWPENVKVYERMTTDSQVDSLFWGTLGQLLDWAWWVEPGRADAGLATAFAEDLGLPLGEPADGEWEPPGAGVAHFNFLEHLQEALLALAFGHYYFEPRGDYPGGSADLWRLAELGPRHPATLQSIVAGPDGRLRGITQQGWPEAGRAGADGVEVPQIPVERLVGYIWRGDARRKWVGRSMFRAMFREWIVKDVLMRIDAINHARAGGVPWAETDETWQGTDLDDLHQLASEFQVGEDSGAATPPGVTMHLLRAGGTDVVGSMRYADEAMARVWSGMVRQLGQTETGSRALGATFGSLEDRARGAVARWFRVNFRERVAEFWWRINDAGYGPGSAVASLACRPPAGAPAPGAEAGGGGGEPPGPRAAPSPPARGGGAARASGSASEHWRRQPRDPGGEGGGQWVGSPGGAAPDLEDVPLPLRDRLAALSEAFKRLDPYESVAAGECHDVAMGGFRFAERHGLGEPRIHSAGSHTYATALYHGHRVTVDPVAEPQHLGRSMAVESELDDPAYHLPRTDTYESVDAYLEGAGARRSQVEDPHDAADAFADELDAVAGDLVDEPLPRAAPGAVPGGATAARLAAMGPGDEVDLGGGYRVERLTSRLGADLWRVVRPGGGSSGERSPEDALARLAFYRELERSRDVRAAAPRDPAPLGVRRGARLPDRPLRRGPTEGEVRAAVDFAEADEAYEAAGDALERHFVRVILPLAVQALMRQVMFTREGEPRRRVTAPTVAGLRPPPAGQAGIEAALLGAARQGARAAEAEARAQGVALPAAPDERLRAIVEEQAEAVARNVASGLGLAASRRASQVARGRTPAEVAGEVERYLLGLEHRWEADQLRGAVQAAQVAGRTETWARMPEERPVLYQASELLDAATCGPCRDVDGREWRDLAGAVREYPFGGYVGCEGGPRCRGTLVAIFDEL